MNLRSDHSGAWSCPPTSAAKSSLPSAAEKTGSPSLPPRAIRRLRIIQPRGLALHLDITKIYAVMPFMRTTLTLDPDVAMRLAAEAARSDRPFKQVVNDALRRGLNPSGKRVRRAAYAVRPVKLVFRPGIDTATLNQLADDLEIEAVAGKLQR